MMLLNPRDFQTHHFANGLYAKEMRIPAGHIAVTHAHKYDHFSILAVGRAKLEIDQVETDYEPGSLILIHKGKKHKVTAVDDIVWFCLHAVEEADADTVDSVLIHEASHAV